MISRTLRAALLMFQTSAGYFPVVASTCRSPRTTFCAVPLTLRVDTWSGNDVGMPELARCVCRVAAGIQGTLPTVIEFQTAVVVYDGLATPVCVSYRPSICGLSHVCESGSFTLCGKSQVLNDF